MVSQRQSCWSVSLGRFLVSRFKSLFSQAVDRKAMDKVLGMFLAGRLRLPNSLVVYKHVEATG